MKIKILIDGVFFQFAANGIARVWGSLLKRLASDDSLDVYVLDRGGVPFLEGISYLPFPTYHFKYNASDSEAIQKVCDLFDIEVFSSTYYTTPLRTPSVMVVHDMIPELFGFNLSDRAWVEKQLSIYFSRRYLCVSNNTKMDLISFYGDVVGSRATVGHCGVDKEVFYRATDLEIGRFKENLGLVTDYFIFVGSRHQYKGYKNSRFFFDSLSKLSSFVKEIVCVGGEPLTQHEVEAAFKHGVKIVRVDCTDEELRAAYSGARALVYPSMYEGFGLPVIEAMACGCAVITTKAGSLEEVAGDAAAYISGTDVDQLFCAIAEISAEGFSDNAIMRRKVRANQFSWDDQYLVFRDLMKAAISDANTPEYSKFCVEWQRLRLLQLNVDV